MTYCWPTTYYYNNGCKNTGWGASSICGRMTLDVDRDNTEWSASNNSWDAGVGGKKVFLIDVYGRVVASTTTADDGSYKFDQLKAGSYKVSFEATDGHNFAQKDVGPAGSDSDANANGTTDWICLSSNQNLCNIDASIQQQVGSVSGSVFCDTNCDGINGKITIVPGCAYVIEAEQMCKTSSLVTVSGAEASGGKLVRLQCGTTGTLSENFGGKSGVYDVIIRVQDENDGQSTIKLKVNGCIVDAVRLDHDTDGGGSDNGGFSDFVIKNVNVNCGNKIELLVYGNGGEYVRIDKMTLQGQSTTTVTAEPLKAHVQVMLLNAAGAVVQTTYTDASGNYKFDNVVPGTYKVMGVAPDGTHFTLKDVGSNDAIDSDVGSDGKSDSFTVVAGGTKDIDLGLCDIEEGSLSGRYFYDANRDNVDNAGDSGIGGKTVYLLASDGVTVIATTTTASNGNYLFTGIAAGNYIVKFQDSTGENRSFVAQDVGGNDTIDSDVNPLTGKTATVTVVANAETKDVDAGVADNVGSLSGRYFFDAGRDNTDNGDAGVAGKTVTLYAANGTTVLGTTTTDANGDYHFNGLVPGSYVVGFQDSSAQNRSFVTQDVGGNDAIDSDVNTATGKTAPVTVGAGQNVTDVDAGVLENVGSLSGRYFFDAGRDNTDNGDAGVVGKTVTLYAANGTTVLGTTTTDANGDYHFNGLVPGSYVVGFQDSSAQNRSFVTQDVGGNDAIDSDVNTATGKTAPVSVGAGQNVTDVDAGVLENVGSLSGRYFFDAGRDNTDNGDAGVVGKTVTLYAANGTTVLGTTTTDANGDYHFNGLIPGSYVVGFQDSTAEGRVFVAQDIGGNDAIDSDVNTVSGKTAPVTVGAGQNVTDVDAGVLQPNRAPIAVHDDGMTCADETLVVNLLGNDSDPEGDVISVVSISDNDETVGVGGTIHLTSGATVTLNANGTATFNGIAAYAGLTIGQQASDAFNYKITDGALTADASVGVTVCGALNTPTSIDERVFNGATVDFTVSAFNANNAINAFTVTLSNLNVPDDFNVPALTLANLGGPAFQSAYCLDYTQKITTTVVTNADLMVATAANALVAGLTAMAADHMDSVNWLLNQHFTTQDNGDGNGKLFTDMEVQEAIYIMLNGDTFFINNPAYGSVFNDNNNGVRDGAERATAENAHQIASLALANGDGFVAGHGDILGLILEPTAPITQDQPFLIGVSFDLYAENCLCA